MRRFEIAAAALVALLLPTAALSQAVPATSSILSSCGTASYTTGQNRPVTADTAGYACVNGTVVTTGTSDVNVKQVNGTTTASGNGATDAGTQRVTISSDSTGTVAATQSGTWNINNVSGTVSLPTGAATAANQTGVQSAAGTPNATAVTVQGNASGVAIPMSAASLPLPAGAATAANQTSVQGIAGTPAATVLSVQGVTGGTLVPTAVSPTSSSALAITPTETTAAASSLVIKATAGNLYGLYVQAGGSTLYLLLYNATTAPADGAVTPVKCYLVPAGTDRAVDWRSGPPLHFSTGIVAVSSSTGCFTQTATNADFISGEAE